MSDCSICYETVIDFPAPEATGSHRSSCGHLFHPKCIATWHLRQEESTCPMCRKVATEMEDCAPQEEEEDAEEEDAEEDEEEEGDGYVGGTIRITWLGMDNLIYSEGGHGVTLSVEEDVGFDENREAVITRYDFERILRQQGIGPFSDAQWLQLQSVYPHDEEEEAVVATAQPQLTFAPSADDEPVVRVYTAEEDAEAMELVQQAHAAVAARNAAAVRHHSRQHPCPLEFFVAGDIPPSYGIATHIPCDICRNENVTIPFYHCPECHFDVCAECFMLPSAPPAEEVIHAPGPFDFVEPEEAPRFTLRRADIQRLLQNHGSMARMDEFFNEENGEEQTLVVTMTLESLNNRFASLGATPLTRMEVVIATAERRETLQITAFADGERDVVVKQRVILNPEEDPELAAY